MATVTMTLYQALARKKTLESQISKIKHWRMCGIRKSYEDLEVTDNVSIEEAKEMYQSAFDSSIKLVDNLATLKAAINQANATIKVVIAGNEYTIAEAIARFRSLDLEEQLYQRMIVNATELKNKVEKTNDQKLSEERKSEYVNKILGDSKKDEALINTTLDTYVKATQVEFYDPLGTVEKATAKLEEILKFREEYHFVLTEANCQNTIDVEFAD